MIRHAAIVTVTYDVLHQALNLPTSVELRGIIGLPLDPASLVKFILIHGALPETAEACWPVELPLERVLDLVAGDG